jgi:hypothetical protein
VALSPGFNPEIYHINPHPIMKYPTLFTFALLAFGFTSAHAGFRSDSRLHRSTQESACCQCSSQSKGDSDSRKQASVAADEKGSGYYSNFGKISTRILRQR